MAKSSFQHRGVATQQPVLAKLPQITGSAHRLGRYLGYIVLVGQSLMRRFAPSYMTRVLRLTLLAPEIVEAILDGTQRPGVMLACVLETFPVEWGGQVEQFS
jgi:hypothetical protein